MNAGDGVVTLGARISALRQEQVLDLISAEVAAGGKVGVASGNLHGLYLYGRDAYLNWFWRHSVVRIDGMPLAVLVGLKHRIDPRLLRATWIDFLPAFISRAVREGWRVYYVGSRRETWATASDRLAARYPSLDFQGHHGYFEFGGELEREVLAEIEAYRPHAILVGMGMGRQERWIHRCWGGFRPGTAVLTCGALMEYVAGHSSTPPRAVGRLGLEWLWRLGSNPVRLWRRYLIEPLHLLADGLHRSYGPSRKLPEPERDAVRGEG